MSLRPLLVLVPLLLASMPTWAAMQAKPVEWKIGEQRFSGALVYDDANSIRRPGLVMVPDWKGVTPAAIEQAKKVAAGGKGVDVLKAQAGAAPLDVAKIGAFGYCFGGSSVLELARDGAQLAGIVTFHGGLETGAPAAEGAVKTPLLVLNGADDRGTAPHIDAFEKEMDRAGADWQFVNFSGAVHCFALEAANSPPGCLYNARAAKRAYRMMGDFFQERFAAE